MHKKTTKAATVPNRPSVSRLFVVPRPSDSLRTKFISISQLELLGMPRSLIKIIFTGTLLTATLLFVLLCVSYLLGNTYVLPRIVICIPVLIYLMAAGFFIAKDRIPIAAWLLIGLYGALGTAILWFWGINAQVGLLTLGFVIVLAGTILGAQYIMPVTTGIVILIAGLQLGNDLGVVYPDVSSLYKESTIADVVGYGIIFAVFALISWLSRRQIEQALRRTLAAEAALRKEKQLLAVRLEEQTRHLREIQLEEMQQLYRFAELGQLSTVVLHELANHLTVLTLDIDDIEQRHHRSEAIDNAKESIHQLDMMVTQVRKRLQETSDVEEFSVNEVIDETVNELSPKASRVNIALVKTSHGPKVDCRAMGDSLRLSQIVTILVNNAIDAYTTMQTPPLNPAIEVDVTSHQQHISISVTDHGIGISAKQRMQLFEPFKSSKEKGMGIGLFIAKKMTETHFKGSITLDPSHELTRFIITVPAYHPLKKSHANK